VTRTSYVRPLAGLLTVLAILAIVALAVGLFRGSFTKTVPLTVISDRAGLVMNPDNRVKMRGVQVGKVSSIESRPDGTAALHLAMDPSQMHLIPANVTWMVLQLCLVVLLLAVWKGRRLGPLVAERLPVVVRASETVEGLRRFNDRDHPDLAPAR